MQATTKDLWLRTKEILAADQRGKKVVTTFRGGPRAVLSPLPNSIKRLSIDGQIAALRAPRF